MMINDILKAFGIEGTPKVFGDGHINTTYSVDGKYVVQKINTDVFTNPAGVMKNCFLVTEFIREKLAELFEELPLKGFSDIAFIIGSSHGLDESLKKECDMRLSMSPMTFAHSLAAVMLTEQIYRGFCIINGDKYHK